MSASKKTCPLLNAASYDGAFCKQDRCAWFLLEYYPDGDYTSGECAMVRIANQLAKEKPPPALRTPARAGWNTFERR